MPLETTREDYAIDVAQMMFIARWIGERERERVIKALSQLPRHTLIPLHLHITDGRHMTREEKELFEDGVPLKGK